MFNLSTVQHYDSEHGDCTISLKYTSTTLCWQSLRLVQQKPEIKNMIVLQPRSREEEQPASIVPGPSSNLLESNVDYLKPPFRTSRRKEEAKEEADEPEASGAKEDVAAGSRNSKSPGSQSFQKPRNVEFPTVCSS